MANTIRIKRRAAGGSSGAPSSLENAELAFTEVDDVLYYGKGTGGAGGTATSVVAIGGSGAFATLGTTQTISGNKTFSGTVALGSSATATTQSSGDNSTKVATTAYVDGAISIASSSFTVAGDSGTNQTITSSDTFTIAGGTGVTTTTSATDTITIAIGQSVGTTDNVTFATVTADLTGDVTGTVSDISNHDTDDLSEGISNLYFTTGRVDDEIDSYVTGGTGVTVTSGQISISLSSFDTGDLAEGTNLYFTTSRVDDEIDSYVTGGTGVSVSSGTISIGQAVGTTDSVTFANVTADLTGNVTGDVSGSAGTVDSLSGHDTDDLAEGTNLYFTTARVDSHLSGGTGVTYSSGTISIGQAVATTSDVTFATATTTGDSSVGGNLTVTGNLTVNGTTTTINSTTLSVDDKNIELAATASPSDASADGAGITVKGDTDHTWNWVDATDAWTSSEHINLASAKAYYINGTSVLNSTTLGSNVVSSSLTSVGTIATGTWQGTAVGLSYGGTGATSASGARSNLGLVIGTDVQAYNSTLAAVAAGTYTGTSSITTLGTIGTGVWQGTAVGVSYGGTGATTAADARTNLGLGTIAVQSASNVTITGGSISSVTLDSVTIDGGTF